MNHKVIKGPHTCHQEAAGPWSLRGCPQCEDSMTGYHAQLSGAAIIKHLNRKAEGL